MIRGFVSYLGNTILILLFTVAVAVGVDSETVAIHINVVNPSGSPLDDVRVKLSGESEVKGPFPESNGCLLFLAKSGTFFLWANRTGYCEANQKLRLDHTETWFTIPMIALFEPQSTERRFIGRVTRFSSSDTWIKLVSLFSSLSQEAKIDEAGAFSFPNVPTGSYMLLVLRSSKLCHMERIEIGPEKREVSIQ